MTMKIILEVIDPHAMRYKTVGDWQIDEVDKKITIQVADTGNNDYNFTLLMHELMEAVLCLKSGITGSQVDAWDLEHEDSDDPGILKGSPYREQHISATIIEDVVLSILKLDPYEYDKVIEMAWYVIERALNKRREEDGV